MRISDWSSDVCSSDLLRNKVGTMGDMAKEPSMEDILSSIKRIIAEESETAATAAVSGIARKSRAKPALSDDIIGGNASTEPLDNDEPDEVLELTDLELRSEEHTSELQSLMSIEYAVFCLKKNTHTIQPNRLHNEIRR